MATVKVSDFPANTPSTAKTPVNTVKVMIDGEPYEMDMTAPELAALFSLFREGHDAAPLRALLVTETATAATPAKRATGKAKTDSETDTTALLASVKAWADRNGHDTAEIKSWAHVNGFPHVEPSKAGRIAADVWISYAAAHGGPAAPAPAPADSAKAASANQEGKRSDEILADAAKTTPAANKTPASVK